MRGSNTERLHDLNKCSEIILSVGKHRHSLEDALCKILSLICTRIGQEEIIGTFLFYLADKEAIGFSWSQDRENSQQEDPYEMERGLIRIVQQKRQPIIVPDLTGSQGRPPGYIEYSPLIHAEIAIPLFQNDTLLGVIDIGSSTVDAFAEEDQVWLEHIAGLFQCLEFQQPPSPLIHTLIDEQNIDDVLNTFLQTVLKTIKLPDAYASILIVDDDRVVSKLALIRHSEAISVDPLVRNTEWSQLRGITGRAIRSKQITIVQNVDEDKDFFYSKDNHPCIVKSEAVFPVPWGTEKNIVGALNVISSETHSFTAALQSELQTLVNNNHLLFYIAQQTEVSRRERSVLDKLAKVTPSAVRAYDIHSIYDRILEATFSLLPTASASQIFETDRQTRQSYIVLQHALQAPQDNSEAGKVRNGHVSEEERSQRYRTDRGIIGEAVRNVVTVYVPDMRDHAEKDYIPILNNAHSDLAIPLSLGNTVFSTLNITSTSIDAFSSRDRKVAELLAAEAGLAISNLQDYGYTIELLKLVVDSIYQAIDSIEDENTLLDTILNSALRVTHTEGGYCSLILLDQKTQTFSIRRETAEYRTNSRHGIWPAYEGIAGRAFREKKPQNVADVKKDPDYIPAATRTCSNLAVPLFENSAVIGVLNLESPMIGAFTDQTVAALQHFGALVVTILKKHTLVDTLQHQQEDAFLLIKHISHLLRWPIQALQDWIKNLPHPGGDGEIAISYLDLILNWLTIRTEILEQPACPLPLQVSNLSELVTSTIQAYRPQATHKAVTIVDESSTQNIHTKCNRNVLQGILFEIFENALHYAHKTILVSVERSLNTIHIRIQDDGDISLSQREWAFDRDTHDNTITDTNTRQSPNFSFIRPAMQLQGGDVVIETRSSTNKTTMSSKEHLILQLPDLTEAEIRPSIKDTVTIFYSYSPKDNKLRQELENQLSTLRREHIIQEWNCQKISPGLDSQKSINNHLDTAHIILLLISPDFIASNYLYHTELQRALDRHKKGEACVIPILLRPTDWQNTPIGTLQPLPHDGTPVTQRRDRDQTFLEIATSIRNIIKEMQ